jgi:hypothetical protein
MPLLVRMLHLNYFWTKIIAICDMSPLLKFTKGNGIESLIGETNKLRI